MDGSRRSRRERDIPFAPSIDALPGLQQSLPLARARLIHSSHLLPSLGHKQRLFPPLLFLLPWRRRLGERRRHLSCLRLALCRRRAVLQVCPPFLFPSAVRDGAPQTLTKLLLFGSESSCNILPTNFDFVCPRLILYNAFHS